MIKPILDQVLVKEIPHSNRSKGGIFLANNLLERSCKAEVIAVGRGSANREMEYKPKDVIFHIKSAGTELIENGEKYYAKYGYTCLH